MQSDARTVDEYLKGLPPERREAIQAVRKMILDSLPEGYEEAMQYGMISYVVPLSRYPQGYLNDKKTPLPYVSLASQKNHMSVYLMSIYGDREMERWFRESFSERGKKPDMGKSCVRFRKIDELPLEVIGEAVAKTPVGKFIEIYERSRKKKK